MKSLARFDEEPAGDQYLYSTGDDESGVHLFRTGDGRLVFESRREEDVYRVVSHAPIEDDEWHQVNGVLDGSRIAVFIDGEESVVDYWEPVTPASPGAGSALVGAAESASGNVALVVDDVIEFDGAQTGNQILSSLSDRGIDGPEIIEVPEPVTTDQDDDGELDGVDNCPADPNPDQADWDDNGVGDACDAPRDADGDEVPDTIDNRPDIFNAEQEDDDSDGVGDLCAGLPDLELDE